MRTFLSFAFALLILTAILAQRSALVAQVVAYATTAPTTVPTTKPTTVPAAPQSLYGCNLFPASDPYNTDISKLPVDPNSKAMMASFTAVAGSGALTVSANMVNFINVATSSTPEYTLTNSGGAITNTITTFPFLPTYQWQSKGTTSESHLEVLNTSTCALSESYSSAPEPPPAWQVSGSNLVQASRYGIQWNLRQPMPATNDGGTNLAHLPYFAGWIRWEDILEGGVFHALNYNVIAHSIRNTCYVPPASPSGSCSNNGYYTGSDWNHALPSGVRLRLPASYTMTCSPACPQTQMILTAMKKYGLFITDTGGYPGTIYMAAYYSNGSWGMPWDQTDLNNLRKLPVNVFEVVAAPGCTTSNNSCGNMPVGTGPTPAPTIKPTATPSPKPTASPTPKPSAPPTSPPSAPPSGGTPIWNAASGAYSVPGGSGQCGAPTKSGGTFAFALSINGTTCYRNQMMPNYGGYSTAYLSPGKTYQWSFTYRDTDANGKPPGMGPDTDARALMWQIHPNTCSCTPCTTLNFVNGPNGVSSPQYWGLYDCKTGSGNVLEYSTKYTPGATVNWQIQVTISSPQGAANGAVRWWYNGVLVYSANNVVTTAGATQTSPYAQWWNFGIYKWRWELAGGGGSNMTKVNATVDNMTLTQISAPTQLAAIPYWCKFIPREWRLRHERKYFEWCKGEVVP